MLLLKIRTIAAMTDYIEDGYTRECIIPERKHSYKACRIVFRPMTAIERTRATARIKLKRGIEPTEKSLVDAENVANEYLAKHVVEWDLRNSQDSEVAITIESFEKLDPNLQGAIYHIVFGNYQLVEGVTFPSEGEDIKN